MPPEVIKKSREAKSEGKKKPREGNLPSGKKPREESFPREEKKNKKKRSRITEFLLSSTVIQKQTPTMMEKSH